VRVLGGEGAVSGRAVQLGGVAQRVAGVGIGQRAHVQIHLTGLEFVATVEIHLQRIAGEPVHAGIPVAHVKAAVAKGIVKTPLQRGLDGLDLAGVLVLATELVVGGQADVARELRAGQQGQRSSEGKAQGLDGSAIHVSSGWTS